MIWQKLSRQIGMMIMMMIMSVHDDWTKTVGDNRGGDDDNDA